jgi:predicted Zn-ribbon and HTH transcriptional regulator
MSKTKKPALQPVTDQALTDQAAAAAPSVSEKPHVNLVQPSACRVCGSTDRAAYHNVRALDFPGETPDGRKYSRVVFRRTKCLACGQVRDDKSLE